MQNIKSALTNGIRNEQGEIALTNDNKFLLTSVALSCKKSSTTQDYDLMRFAQELIAVGIAPTGFEQWIEMNSVKNIQKFIMDYAQGNETEFPVVDISAGENGKEREMILSSQVEYMDAGQNSWTRVKSALAYAIDDKGAEVEFWNVNDYGFASRGVAGLLKQDFWGMDAVSTDVKEANERVGSVFVIPASGSRKAMTVQVIFKGFGNKNLIQRLA